MDRNQELRVYMKAARAKFDDGNGRHLSEDEMIAYCHERMAAAEREEARLHILQCGHCLQLFRDVSDFFEPRREDEEEIDQLQIRRAWNDFWPRVRTERKVTSRIVESVRRISFPSAAWGLAAGLLITLGPAPVLVWRESQQRRQAQQQIAQMQNEQSKLEARLGQIEQNAGDELRQERERRIQIEARAQALQNRLSELQQARQNIPIYSRVLSSEKGQGDDWHLSIPPGAKIFWLSLTRGKPYEFLEYSIELLDQQGKRVAERRRLRPVGAGSLSFSLSRPASAGNYSLLLYGHRGKSKRGLGKYELSLSFSR